MRAFTNLFKELRERFCDQVRRLDLLVAGRGVSFLLVEGLDALCSVAYDAGHYV